MRRGDLKAKGSERHLKLEPSLDDLAPGLFDVALILDGRQPSSLRRYLLDGEPLGTVVTA